MSYLSNVQRKTFIIRWKETLIYDGSISPSSNTQTVISTTVWTPVSGSRRTLQTRTLSLPYRAATSFEAIPTRRTLWYHVELLKDVEEDERKGLSEAIQPGERSMFSVPLGGSGPWAGVVGEAYILRLSPCDHHHKTYSEGWIQHGQSRWTTGNDTAILTALSRASCHNRSSTTNFDHQPQTNPTNYSVEGSDMFMGIFFIHSFGFIWSAGSDPL